MTTEPKKPPSPGHAPLTVAEAQTGNDLLTIMGNVLASWQGVEHTIADIYLVFFSPRRADAAAVAFYAVRTFESRLAIVNALITFFCSTRHKTDWSDLYALARKRSKSRAALARVRIIWNDPNVYGPFIMEKAGGALWNQVELARVVDGDDKGAPTVRNMITRLANYILENSAAFVRGVKTPTIEEIDASTVAIRATAEALLQLAAESETRCVTYPEFESLLKRLHELGSYPTNRQVSDVAHAIHGEEIVDRWR